MKTYLIVSLSVAALTSLVPAFAGEASGACKPKACDVSAVCPKTGEAEIIAALQAKALACPASAGALLKAQVARNPELLEKLTVALIGSFAEKLPAQDLGDAVQALMKTASGLLAESLVPPVLMGEASAEECRQALLAQDLKLAGSVYALTEQAVAAIRTHLRPANTLSNEYAAAGGEESLVIDPVVFSNQMKYTMEQAVRGALSGLGSRVAGIPTGQLPSVAAVTRDPGAYTYSLRGTALGETVPSAVAAPVEEKK